jgi:hypothetical protein
VSLKSLSNIVTASLPSDIKDPFSPTPVALWKHLEATYSAQNGARTAALLQEVWGKVIPEGENPASHIGRINSCYAEIIQGKIDHDTMLAFAMIQALPESFATIKQALWLRTPLKSADVAAAVQAEWSRRSSGEENVALKARLQQAGRGFTPRPRDGSKYCDLNKTTGHSNDQCYLQGAPRPANNTNNNNKPRFPAKANVATTPTVATAENRVATVNNDDSDSDSVKSYVAHTNSVANNNNSTYIVDSGATHHMVVNSTLLHDVKPIATQWIVVGNGEKVPASSVGTLKLGKAVFTDVLVAPGLDRNLISVGASTNKWEFDKQSATLVDCNNNNTAILTAQRSGGLYIIKASEIAIAMSATADQPSYSVLRNWHERLGHVNVRRIMMMGRDGRIDGLSQVSAREVNEFECEFCIRGKGKRLPSPRSNVCSTTPLAPVHIDLWGPATTTSTGGSKYFLTCYDNYTHRIDLSFLKLISDAFVAMTNYIAKVARQLNCKVKMIRSDNGGEFTSKQWENYMLANGIVHVKVVPDAHAQNGRVERVHLTILDDVRTLLLQSGLPPSHWAEAAAYPSYIRNHTPADNKNTPLNLWYNQKTTVEHLQPFGCKVYYREHHKISKLQPRYKEGRLLSYTPDSHTCRILDIATKRTVASRDVVYAQDKGIATELQELQLQQTTTFATPKTTKVRFATLDVDDEGDSEVLQLQQPVLQQPVLQQQELQQPQYDQHQPWQNRLRPRQNTQYVTPEPVLQDDNISNHSDESDDCEI